MVSYGRLDTLVAFFSLSHSHSLSFSFRLFLIYYSFHGVVILSPFAAHCIILTSQTLSWPPVGYFPCPQHAPDGLNGFISDLLLMRLHAVSLSHLSVLTPPPAWLCLLVVVLTSIVSAVEIKCTSQSFYSLHNLASSSSPLLVRCTHNFFLVLGITLHFPFTQP